MGKTKQFLNQITPAELKNLEILYEIIGPKYDNSI